MGPTGKLSTFYLLTTKDGHVFEKDAANASYSYWPCVHQGLAEKALDDVLKGGGGDVKKMIEDREAA